MSSHGTTSISVEPTAPPLPPRNTARSIGRSLARGGVAVGMALGGFFGVTEESQQGTQGWREWREARAEDSNIVATLSRRGTIGRRLNQSVSHDEPPPDYNTLEMNNVRPSFNMADLGDSDDSSDDEAGFLSEAPPDYVSLANNNQYVPPYIDARVSMYGPEDPTAAARNVPNLVPIHEVHVEQVPTVAPALPTSATPSEADFIYDVDEGYRYYMEYLRVEKAVRQRRQRENAGEFFGSGRDGGGNGAGLQRAGSVRRGRMGSIDHGDRQRQRRRRRKGKTKLERQNTLVREQLASLPSFWPIFIIGISFVQLVATGVLIPLRGLEAIHPLPELRTGFFPSLSDPSGNASSQFYLFRNMWIGMNIKDLIQVGAKFTPCMRLDFSINNRNTQRSNMENDLGGLGCCRNGNTSWVGTATPSSIDLTTYPALAPKCSSSDPDQYRLRMICNVTNERTSVNFHPCCISITGHCLVTNQQECSSRRGIFHEDLDNCNQTNCLNDICGLNGVGTVNGVPIHPSGSQGYRLVLALFIHLGAIHVIIILVIQLYLGVKIERAAGFLRVAIIYFLSGVGGYLLSSIFVPYNVTAGATPAVFGLLAVAYVELFQSWRVIERAWLELIKLIVILIFLVLIGTLPLTDNFTAIGGFLIGVPSALIFLPYVTFSKTGLWVKRILLIVCIPVVLVLFIVGFMMFYLVRSVDFCFFCHYISCIPYVSELCVVDMISATLPNQTYAL